MDSVVQSSFNGRLCSDWLRSFHREGLKGTMPGYLKGWPINLYLVLATKILHERETCYWPGAASR